MHSSLPPRLSRAFVTAALRPEALSFWSPFRPSAVYEAWTRYFGMGCLLGSRMPPIRSEPVSATIPQQTGRGYLRVAQWLRAGLGQRRLVGVLRRALTPEGNHVIRVNPGAQPLPAVAPARSSTLLAIKVSLLRLRPGFPNFFQSAVPEIRPRLR